jgi:molybdopterin-guanine dinucleotide biosynthesis protein A
MAFDLLRGAAERANALRAGVILIGGASSRMGVDKSALMLDGQTMLDRTIAAISALVGEILIVGKPGSPVAGSDTPATDGASPTPGGFSGAPPTAPVPSMLGLKPGVDLGALLHADGPHLRSASSPTRTSFPTGKPDRGLLGNLGPAGGNNRSGPAGESSGRLFGAQTRPAADGVFRGLEHAAQTASLTIRRVADRWPGEGPLGGILSAFASTTAMEILVVAVDLPWLSVDSLRALCLTPMTVADEASSQPTRAAAKGPKTAKLTLEERPADCVMTLHQARLQPLHARYTRRCESLMATQFGAGERSIVRCQLVVAEHRARDDDRSSLDVDTPEEWASVTNPQGR